MEIVERFLENIRQTSALEFIAVFFGIASVWFSRMENILVYPVGLVNTIIYIYLSVKAYLFGEATVNLYYTIVSIYGWVLWTKKDNHAHHLIVITSSNSKEWVRQLLFFACCYLVIYAALAYLEKHFTPGAIPWADALASASAFTAMWLMAKKKVESWYWWIITNIASIPLYYVKNYMLTSVYYLVLLFMAFWGLAEWMRKAKLNREEGEAAVLSSRQRGGIA